MLYFNIFETLFNTVYVTRELTLTRIVSYRLITEHDAKLIKLVCTVKLESKRKLNCQLQIDTYDNTTIIQSR